MNSRLGPRALRLALLCGAMIGAASEGWAEGPITFPPPPAPPPSTPDRRDQAPTPDDPPPFGADLALGYLAGTLAGPWPESGVHGALMFRYDAFAVSRAASGPRLGLSLWGATSVWPGQVALEPSGEATNPTSGAEAEATEEIAIDYIHYGVLGVLRGDPSAPFSPDFGLGFGRLDLDAYHGGPLALPTLSFEAGLRRRVTDRSFADLLLRASWATQRSGLDPTALEEWWLVQAGVELGAHLR